MSSCRLLGIVGIAHAMAQGGCRGPRVSWPLLPPDPSRDWTPQELPCPALCPSRMTFPHHDPGKVSGNRVLGTAPVGPSSVTPAEAVAEQVGG